MPWSLLVTVSVAVWMPAPPVPAALKAMPMSTYPPTGMVAGRSGRLVMTQLFVSLSAKPAAGIDSGAVPVLVRRSVCVALGVVLELA